MGEAARIALRIPLEINARCVLPVVEVGPFWFRAWRMEGTEENLCQRHFLETVIGPCIRVNTTGSAVLLCDRRWMVQDRVRCTVAKLSEVARVMSQSHSNQ
jgi:hypothetical protein